MAGFCIHCGKKLEDGQTCNCQTISSQQLQGQSPVKEQEAVPMASNHTAETGKGIQINIDQEMVDKLVNGTVNNVGNGVVFLKEFIKNPISTLMGGQIKDSTTVFLGIFQIIAFVLFEIACMSNIDKMIGKFLGSFTYWTVLDNEIDYGNLCLKGILIIIVCMGTFTLLIQFVMQKIGKVPMELKHSLSLALVSTIPLTLGYLVGAVFLMILPSLSGICIIAGVLLSIILGSYSLVSQMQVNKNQSMYIATGVYTLQVILVFYVIKAVTGM